uniref:Periodic tryptophan protein 2 homolog n=1 Tax=Hirondellea gigas TaxID=1518452 RepID=A0A2P2I4L5_9CRUS
MYFQYKFSNLLGTVYRKGQLVFSRDGDSIFVPVGNKITCYDLRNGRSYTMPVEISSNFSAMAISPDGLLLLASSDAGNMYMISVLRRRIIYTKIFKKSCRAIEFSPDGKYFAIARGTKVYVYKCAGMQHRLFNPFDTERVCSAATSSVMCLAWSFDSRLLVFGSLDMVTRVFPVKNMQLAKQVAEMGNNTSSIIGVHFQPNTYHLYTVCQSGKIKYFECQLKPEELHERESYAMKLARKAEQVKKEQAVAGTEEEGTNDVKPMEVEESVKWLNYRLGHNYSAGTLMLLHKKNNNEASSDDEDDDDTKEVQHDKRVTIKRSCYHNESDVLVIACTNGNLALFDMKDGCSLLHRLRVSTRGISSVAINLTGDWVALGVPYLGQLVVWEMRSENYVLKQQGHSKNMSVVAYSPDGSCIATGGEDGKVKLWSTVSSFCYVTFTEHTAAITGLAFTQSGRAVLSSSLDGTVRAFDMMRYRNFKTLTSPQATQFTCLAVDTSGELVAAGGQDSHQIYVWSLKLGSLLEVLSGHTGPVRSICFSPAIGSSMLVSTAWDRTLKIWDNINTTQARESILLHADGISLCLRPDGEQVSVAAMDGNIYLFNCRTATEEGCIEGRRDLGLTREFDAELTADKTLETKYFEKLCYSSDGKQLLAGGKSKYVCVYSTAEMMLVKKYTITENRSLEGTRERFSVIAAKTGVRLSQVERRGAKTLGGDHSLRSFRRDIRVTDLAFAPTGRSFVVCCSEGMLIYSQDSDWLFDPLSLDIENTPSAVKRKLKQEEWGLALMMAIKLNIDSVKKEVLESIPMDALSVVVSGLPPRYVEGLLQFLAEGIESTQHVGVYARWARDTLFLHGTALKARAPQMITAINALYRALNMHHNNLNSLCASNEHTLRYLRRECAVRKHKTRMLQLKGDADKSDAENDQQTPEQMDQDSGSDDGEDMQSLVAFGDSDTDTELTELVK